MVRNKKKPRIDKKRWQNYTFCGELLKNSRIVCSKTPVSSFNHSPELLIHSFNSKNKKYKIGLVIDLSDTSKYYNSNEFIALNVMYYKIQCKGMSIPCESTVDHFKSIVSNYLLERERTNKVICVHCFNGVNRTGYLVCRYLIDVLKYDAITAINIFQDARGHTIEHDFLRQDLLKRKSERTRADKEKCLLM